MIRYSYLFLDNVGKEKEKQIINQAGNWSSFLKAEKIKGISKEKKQEYNNIIKQAQTELLYQNHSHFKTILPQIEHWRLFRHFQEDAIYLDIETTGIQENSEIFMIGIYDGFNTKIMIKNLNFNLDFLQSYLNTKKLIITYNGSSYDIPKLKKAGITFNQPHIDLKHVLAKLNLKGGLKQIEKQFKIERNPILQKLCGGDVYRLWKMAMAAKDDYYLNLLIEYNEDDVYNLKKLMLFAYEELKNTLLS